MAILCCLSWVGVASAEPQSQPLSQPFLFHVFDADGHPVMGAKVTVNGQVASYVTYGTERMYKVMGPTTGTVDVAVAAKGFLGIRRKNMPATQYFHQLYLRRKNDPWFTDPNGMPVAYSTRPRDVLVLLQDYDKATNRRFTPATAAATLLALPALATWQLVEVDWDSVPSKPYAKLSLSRPVGTKLLLRAPHALPKSGLAALAALRGHAWVQSAGPIVVHGDNYRDAYAVGTKIQVSPNTEVMKDYGQGELLAARFGGRYNPPSEIAFDASAGAVVVEAANSLASSGLFRSCEVEFATPTETDN